MARILLASRPVDGKPAELTFAGKVLDALRADTAVVPATWGVRIDLPLATLDEDLQKAAKKVGVKRLR